LNFEYFKNNLNVSFFCVFKTGLNNLKIPSFSQFLSELVECEVFILIVNFCSFVTSLLLFVSCLFKKYFLKTSISFKNAGDSLLFKKFTAQY